MAASGQGINIPVTLQIQNLQSLVGDLQKQLGNLKVGSAGFKAVQSTIESIRKEIDKLSVQTAKPFMDASQFTKAERSVDNLEDKINSVTLAISKIKFGDLELTSGQKADLKAFEDQIEAIKSKLKNVKQAVKDDFLNSAEGQQWLNIDGTAITQSLDQITKGVVRATKEQKDAFEELQKQATSYQKALNESQRIKDFTDKMVDDPANGTDLFSKKWQELTKTLSNGKVQFKEGGKNLMVQWLESQLKLDSGVLDSLLKQGVSAANIGQKLKQLLNDQLAKDQSIITNNEGAGAAAEQARVKYEELEAILQRVGLSQQQISEVTDALSASLRNTAQASQEYKDGLVASTQQGMQSNATIGQMKTQLDSLRNTLQQTNAQFIQMQRTQQSFNQMKMAVVNFMGFTQVLNLTKTAIRNAINHIKELDSVMNKISIVTDMSTGDLWNQVDAYSKMAQTYGVSIKGAYEVSQIYYQQGLQTNDVLTLTNETLKLAKISGLDYATTTDYMTTALRGFKMEMSEAATVVDVYSNLAAHTAVSQEELAVAMSKTASSMESVGTTFEEASAMIGTMVAVTRESATNIGSAMKSIASRYGELTKDPTKLVDEDGEAMAFNKVDAALQSVGISMKTVDGQFREFTDVIIELGEKWDQLDSVQQRYIATQFAGNRQQSRFLALVSNVDLLKSNINYAENSEDTGTLQALKALDSIESKIEQVRVAYQQFYTTIGAENIWKGFLDGAKNVINTLNSLPKLFGKLPVGAIAAVTNIISLIKGLGIKLISGFATTFGKGIFAGMQAASSQAKNGAENLFNTINSTLEGKLGEAKNTGRRLAESTIEGSQQVVNSTRLGTISGKNRILYDNNNTVINRLGNETDDAMAISKASVLMQNGIITQEEFNSVNTQGAKAARELAVAYQLRNQELEKGAQKELVAASALQTFGSALHMVSMMINTAQPGMKTLSGSLMGVSGIMQAVGGIWQGFITHVKTGNSILSSIPWMAVLSGIMAVINGISTIIVTPEERLEELEKKAEDLNNKAKEAKANYRTLDNAKKKLDELEKKRYDSAEAAEEYQEAVNDLADKFPELVTAFDTAGNAIIETSTMEETLAVARKKTAQATYEAAKAEMDSKKLEMQIKANNINNRTKVDTANIGLSERNATAEDYSGIRRASGPRTYTIVDDLYKIMNSTMPNQYTRGAYSGNIYYKPENYNTDLEAFQGILTSMVSAWRPSIQNGQIKTQFLQGATGGQQETATKVLQGLYDSKAISYDEELKKWIYDLNNAREYFMSDLVPDSFSYNKIKDILQDYNFGETESIANKNSLEDQLVSIVQLYSEFYNATDKINYDIKPLKQAIAEYNIKFRNTDTKANQDIIDSIKTDLDSYTLEMLEYEQLQTDLTTAERSLINGWQLFNDASGEQYKYVSKSAALMSAINKQVKQNLDDEGLAYTEENILAVGGVDYQNIAEEFITKLNDKELEIFNRMLEEGSLQDIVKYFGTTLENGEEKYTGFSNLLPILVTNYQEATTRIFDLLDNKFQELFSSSEEEGQEFETLWGDSDFIIDYSNWLNQLDEDNHGIVNKEAIFLNNLLDHVSELRGQGLISQSDNYGSALFDLFKQIQNLPEDVQATLINTILTNGITTAEDLQKTLTYIKSNKAYSSLDTTQLEAVIKEFPINIALTMQSLLGTVQEAWKNDSKELASLSSGITFDQIDSFVNKAHALGLEEFSADNFLADGDKFILSAEDYIKYINAYIENAGLATNELVTQVNTAKDELAAITFNTEDGLNESEIAKLRLILGTQFDDYIQKGKDEIYRVIVDNTTLQEAIATSYQTRLNDISQLSSWLNAAGLSLTKSAQWAEGNYSSLSSALGEDYNNTLLQLTKVNSNLSKYKIPDVKNAVEKIREAYNNLISDVLENGFDNIDFSSYKGIIGITEDEFNTYVSSGRIADFIKKYAEYTGKTIDETNDLILQAINKDREQISQDLIKDFSFINTNTFTASLDSLTKLANAFDISIQDWIDKQVIRYDEQLGAYIVNTDATGIDFEAIEGFKEYVVDSINSFINDLIGDVSNGISGKLSYQDVSSLQSRVNTWLKSNGANESIQLDYTRTAEGLKLTEDSFFSLYASIRKIDKLSVKKLLPDIKNLSGQYGNLISATEAYNKAVNTATTEANNTKIALGDLIKSMMQNPDTYKVLDQELPTEWKIAQNFYESSAEGVKLLQTAGKKGTMSVEDFYSLVSASSSLNPDFMVNGMDADALMAKAAESLTMVDGKLSVDLKKAGILTKNGIKQFTDGFIVGMENLRKQELAYQETETRFEQITKAFNSIEPIDFKNLFDSNGNFSSDTKDYLKKLQEAAKENEQLESAFKSLQFNGQSLYDLINSKNGWADWKEAGFTQESIQHLFSNLSHIDFNMDDIVEQLETVFSGQNLTASIKTDNGFIGIDYEGNVINYDLSDKNLQKRVRAAISEYLPDFVSDTKDLSDDVQKMWEQYHNDQTDTKEKINLRTVLGIAANEIDVNIDKIGKSGNRYTYKFNGKTFTAGGNSKNAAKAEIEKAIGESLMYEDMGFTTDVDFGTGKVTGHMKVGEANIDVTTDNGDITYTAHASNGQSKSFNNKNEALGWLASLGDNDSAGVYHYDKNDYTVAIHKKTNRAYTFTPNKDKFIYKGKEFPTYQDLDAYMIADSYGGEEHGETVAPGVDVITKVINSKLGIKINITNNNGKVTTEYEVGGQTLSPEEFEEYMKIYNDPTSSVHTFEDGTTGLVYVKDGITIQVGISGEGQVQYTATMNGHTITANDEATLRNSLLALSKLSGGSGPDGTTPGGEDNTITYTDPKGKTYLIKIHGDGEYEVLNKDKKPITADQLTTDASAAIGAIVDAAPTVTTDETLNAEANKILLTLPDGSQVSLDSTVTEAITAAIQAASQAVTITVEEEGATSAVERIQNAINKLQGKTVDVIVKETIQPASSKGTPSKVVKPFQKEPPKRKDQQYDLAQAKGTRSTLMGELGPELYVTNGHYYVAGQNGAEFVDLPEDAIVFNHLQTQKLLLNGKSGRGKPLVSEQEAVAFAHGNINGGPAHPGSTATVSESLYDMEGLIKVAGTQAINVGLSKEAKQALASVISDVLSKGFENINLDDYEKLPSDIKSKIQKSFSGSYRKFVTQWATAAGKVGDEINELLIEGFKKDNPLMFIKKDIFEEIEIGQGGNGLEALFDNDLFLEITKAYNWTQDQINQFLDNANQYYDYTAGKYRVSVDTLKNQYSTDILDYATNAGKAIGNSNKYINNKTQESLKNANSQAQEDINKAREQFDVASSLKLVGTNLYNITHDQFEKIANAWNTTVEEIASASELQDDGTYNLDETKLGFKISDILSGEVLQEKLAEALEEQNAQFAKDIEKQNHKRNAVSGLSMISEHVYNVTLNDLQEIANAFGADLDKLLDAAVQQADGTYNFDETLAGIDIAEYLLPEEVLDKLQEALEKKNEETIKKIEKKVRSSQGLYNDWSSITWDPYYEMFSANLSDLKSVFDDAGKDLSEQWLQSLQQDKDGKYLFSMTDIESQGIVFTDEMADKWNYYLSQQALAREKQIADDIGNIMSTFIEKGFGRIDFREYTDLPQEVIDNIKSSAFLSRREFVEKWADETHKTINEINSIYFDAWEKDLNISSKDASKNMQYYKNGGLSGSSSDWTSLLGDTVKVSELVRMGLLEYNETLGTYYSNNLQQIASLANINVDTDIITDSINSLFKTIADTIQSSLETGISNTEATQFKEQLSLMGLGDVDITFEKGLEGLKLSQASAISLYNELKKIDAIQAELVFKNLYKSLSESNDKYKTMTSLIVNIVDLQEKIDQADKYNDAKVKQYKEELALAKEIAAVRATSEDSSFNFLDQDIPGAMNNPLNYVKNWSTAWNELREAATDNKSIDFQHFYNILGEINNLAKASGQTLDFMGTTLDGSLEAWDKAVNKSIDALGTDADKNYGVLLSKFGDDLSGGADAFASSADGAIHTMAKSQIKILDALIQMFEAIVAMEEFEGADLNLNDILDFEEVFQDTELEEQAEKLTDPIIKAATTLQEKFSTNGELRQAFEAVKVNGYSMAEIVEDAAGGVRKLNLNAQDYAAALSVLYEMSKRGDFDLKTIAESLREQLTLNHSNFEGNIEYGDFIFNMHYNVQIKKNENGQYVTPSGKTFDNADEAIHVAALEELAIVGAGKVENITVQADHTAQGTLTIANTEITVDALASGIYYTVNGQQYNNLEAAEYAIWDSSDSGLEFGEWKLRQGLTVRMSIHEVKVENLTKDQIANAVGTTWKQVQDEWEAGVDQNGENLSFEAKYGISLDKDTTEADWEQFKELAGVETKTVEVTANVQVTEGSQGLMLMLEKGIATLNIEVAIDETSKLFTDGDFTSNLVVNLENAQKALAEFNSIVNGTTATEKVDSDTTEGENAAKTLRDLINAMQATITVAINDKASDIIDDIQEKLDKLKDLTITIEATENTTSTSDGGSQAKGNVAMASGTRTLMGELGPELYVSDGRYHVAGENGAEFVNLPKDAIVFNHLQTQRLLSTGSTGRGRAVTSEANAVALAKGGPAAANAQKTLATLKQLRAMWSKLAEASIIDLAGAVNKESSGDKNKVGSWVADVEHWYNLLQKIARLEKEINYQEALRSKIEADRVPNGIEYYQSQVDSLKNLREQAATQKLLADSYDEYFEIRRKELNESPLSKFYEFNEAGQVQYKEGGLYQLASLFELDDTGKARYTPKQQYDILKSMGLGDYMLRDSNGLAIERDEENIDQFYYDSVQAAYERMTAEQQEMQDLYNNKEDAKVAYLEAITKADKLLQDIIDNQMDMEQKVLDAIEVREQKIIDKMTKERQALADSSAKYFEGLEQALSKEREMYSRQQDQDSLAKLQRRLSILQRSGGSASEIASLQQEITDKQRDAYFEAQEAAIQEAKDASDLQLEKMQEQIDLMTETLEYEKANGLLWGEVATILSGTSESIMEFITTNMPEWQEKSATAQNEELRTLRNSTQQWVAYYNNGEELVQEMMGGVQESVDGLALTEAKKWNEEILKSSPLQLNYPVLDTQVAEMQELYDNNNSSTQIDKIEYNVNVKEIADARDTLQMLKKFKEEEGDPWMEIYRRSAVHNSMSKGRYS